MSVKWNNPYALPLTPCSYQVGWNTNQNWIKYIFSIPSIIWISLPLLILITSPRGGGNSEKLKKGGGSMVQGQFFLKGGGWYFYLIFSRFIIFKSRNYFILSCKIALYVALCSTITSWKKFIQSCLNMNLKISHIN